LNARNIEATLTRVITDTPKEEGFHYGSYVASVRVEWDEPADEVRHGAALRRHIAEINSEADDQAADFGFNPTEYALWGMAGTADRAFRAGGIAFRRLVPGRRCRRAAPADPRRADRVGARRLYAGLGLRLRSSCIRADGLDLNQGGIQKHAAGRRSSACRLVDRVLVVSQPRGPVVILDLSRQPELVWTYPPI
jgi:hypothetical protein